MSRLILWFEKLLFGSSSPICTPPDELKDIILRMEVENIPWSHIIRQGGLTDFAYQVHGDLNYLTDYLEKQWLDNLPPSDPRPFKTRAVSKFWNELQLLLSRRNAERVPALPISFKRDDEILRDLLEGSSISSPIDYQSAAFWGEVARRFINLRRLERPSPLPNISTDYLKRVLKLYDITSQARGHYFDPFNCYFVHYSEYLNAGHWQTDRTLEAFMHDRPLHPLTVSIQALLRRTLQELLHGEKPSALLSPCPRLDALLHNLHVIHDSVPQVPHDNTPPKLIDVVQRLLALCHRDRLWERVVPIVEPVESGIGTSLLFLTEQMRISERERRVLLERAIERTETFDSGRHERTCDAYLYASHKPRPREKAQELQIYPR